MARFVQEDQGLSSTRALRFPEAIQCIRRSADMHCGVREPNDSGSLKKGRAMTTARALNTAIVTSFFLALVPIAHSEEKPAIPSESPHTILSKSSMWRYYHVWKTEEVQKEDGTTVLLDSSIPFVFEKGWTKNKTRGLRTLKAALHTPLPPPDWTRPDFNDRNWSQVRGSFLGPYRSLSLICVRGKFEVQDPEKVKELRLDLAFQGGAVVHINGREVARAFLPKGAIDDHTLAEAYPKEAYVSPKGSILGITRSKGPRFIRVFKKENADRYALRIRKMSAIRIPGRMLRKGCNVLAIEIHRAPALEVMFTGLNVRGKHREHLGWRTWAWWDRAALEDVKLTAPATASVVPNLKRPGGIRVWNHSVVRRLRTGEYADPNEPLRPIRITGTRNGTFHGKIIVSSSKPVGKLEVSCSGLKGPSGTLSAQIQYEDITVRRGRRSFDGLTTHADPHFLKSGGDQPVWILVRVPAGNAASDYTGTVTVKAENEDPLEIPVHLTVKDWELPNTEAFKSFVGLIQSPESVASRYETPMWSEQHWKLMDRSFELMGQVGGKVLYLPMIRRTHFGNEHTMVRWIKKNGTLVPDFSIAEKYIDMAARHLKKIPCTILYLWEISSQGRWPKGMTFPSKGQPITILDPSTGELTKGFGPEWGSPEVRTFWKPVIDGIRKILAKHGLEKSMLFGLAGDIQPSRTVVGDLHAIAPDIHWACVSHYYHTAVGKLKLKKRSGVPIDYMATVGDVWGLYYDPTETRVYGWKHPKHVVTFARGGGNQGIPWGQEVSFRFCSEGSSLSWRNHSKMPSCGRGDVVLWSKIRGFGRFGADFWPAIKDKQGAFKHRVHGRFPENSWGQLTMRSVYAALLHPDKGGPSTTIRYEFLRQGLQEAEARYFIEDVLTDDTKRARIGNALAKKSQALLDDRTRHLWHICNYGLWRWPHWHWRPSPAWEDRGRKLYEAAAEISKALK